MEKGTEGKSTHWEGGDVANILFDMSYTCVKQDSACQSASLPNCYSRIRQAIRNNLALKERLARRGKLGKG